MCVNQTNPEMDPDARENAPKRCKTDPEDSAFICEAQNVIHFHLLESTDRESLLKEIESRKSSSADSPLSFQGEFFHQVCCYCQGSRQPARSLLTIRHVSSQHFEDENIRGYQGLHVDIWISAHTYHTLLDIKVRPCSSAKSHHKLQWAPPRVDSDPPPTQWSKRKPGADKVTQILKEHFPLASNTQTEFLDAVLSTLASAPVGLYAGGHVLATLDTPKHGQVLFVKFQLTATDEASVYVKVEYRKDQSMAERPYACPPTPCAPHLIRPSACPPKTGPSCAPRAAAAVLY